MGVLKGGKIVYLVWVIDEGAISRRYEALRPALTERGRRLFAAAEAMTAGYGGVTAVSAITGIARSTINRGIAEIKTGADRGTARVRQAGGGRRKLSRRDPGLVDDLRVLLEPATRGDPQRRLLWTSKSLRHLAATLAEMGHRMSHETVGALLRELGYRVQANRKTREGAGHPDRDAQFEYINARVNEFQAAGQPVISVDTKKKELVGDFKNRGREYRARGTSEEVRGHDFLIKEIGRAVPYGVYDIAANTGWVIVGMSADTASFAVESIRRWWRKLGRERYPEAGRLYITADAGGSNRAGAAVETGVAGVGERDRSRDRRLAPAARDQQVEQDRAPAVLLHQPELARSAARQLPDHRATDRRHHDQHRPEGALRTRHQHLCQGHRSQRLGNGGAAHHVRRLSW